jgi:ribosomal protein S21
MSRPVNVEVKNYNNLPIEVLIRKFNKKVKKERILETYRENMYYEKPSVKRRREKIRRKKLIKKLQKERESR